MAIFEEDLGPESRYTAVAYLNLGGAQLEHGDVDEARAELERAAAALEKLLGARHPAVAEALGGLGEAYGRLGRDAEARATLDRALDIDVARFGAEHPRVAKIRMARGEDALRAGRYQDALAEFQTVVRIRARFPDEDVEAEVEELVGVGRSLLALRRVPEAIATLEHAVQAAQQPRVPPARVAEAQAELARARGGAQSLRSRRSGP